MQFTHSLGSGVQEIALPDRALKGSLMSVQISEIKVLNAFCFLYVPHPQISQELPWHFPNPTFRSSFCVGPQAGTPRKTSVMGIGGAVQRQTCTDPQH